MGKASHDAGSFKEAAELFADAREPLLPHLSEHLSNQQLLSPLSLSLLHESLCHLKSSSPSSPSQALKCLALLLGDAEFPGCGPLPQPELPPAVRARAHHRRARAHLLQGDLLQGDLLQGARGARGDAREEARGKALEEAKRGAFLGDAKAAKLYGELLRGGEPGPAQAPTQAPTSPFASPFASPFSLPPAPPSSPPTPTSLVSSLLSKADAALSTPSSRSQISSLLTSLTPESLASLSAAAGAPLPPGVSERLAPLLARCSPENLERLRSWASKIARAVKLASGLLRLAKEYRHFLVYYLIYRFARRSVRA
ncbi:hypothetical protein TeGR_g10872 [Tetraparma gracilis]|uniref:CCR4-NOT transcription complex subunit 11 n=1 Tax=Tetraparma gracilis TaxID=2962635 RepID=A0ABQ6MNJ1_9STRA|nr:hypothetical protein TeGR_g10872 [Tetraparma gracilis]